MASVGETPSATGSPAISTTRHALSRINGTVAASLASPLPVAAASLVSAVLRVSRFASTGRRLRQAAGEGRGPLPVMVDSAGKAMVGRIGAGTDLQLDQVAVEIAVELEGGLALAERAAGPLVAGDRIQAGIEIYRRLQGRCELGCGFALEQFEAGAALGRRACAVVHGIGCGEPRCGDRKRRAGNQTAPEAMLK